MIINDNSAQMEVLESIMMVAMIFLTLFFAQNLDFAFYETITYDDIITDKAETTLSSLDNVPSTYQNFSTLLVQYLMGEGYENKTYFSNYFFPRVYPAINYEVTIYNISMMFLNSSANNYKSLFQDYGGIKTGRMEQAHWFFVFNDYLYEISVKMWYI